MKLHNKAQSTNYSAQIIELPEPFKHPNADRLFCVSVNGNIVITGSKAQKGEHYIFFPLECAINREFLAWSNSFSDANLNADPLAKGFFPSSGRVKAVRLRGQPSMGYIIPVSLLSEWLESKGLSPLADYTINQEFDSCGDILICEKYIPASVRTKSSGTPRSRDHKVVRHSKVIEGQFRFHVDTANLRKNIHNVLPEDIITISYKLHGTSGVFSKVLCNRKLTWKDKLARFLGVEVRESHYDHLYSSRSVLKNGTEYVKKEHNHFYGTDIWGEAHKIVAPAIRDGYTLYAEIVGYTPSGGAIQKSYDYGCAPSSFKVYIYRITYTNASHDVFELSFPQIERYCQKNNLNMVPVLYHGRADGYLPFTGNRVREESLKEWQNNLLDHLSIKYLEKECHMCTNKVPAEGIVIAIERDQFTAFKLKSFAFLEGETKALDEGTIDIETQESIENKNTQEVYIES